MTHFFKAKNILPLVVISTLLSACGGGNLSESNSESSQQSQPHNLSSSNFKSSVNTLSRSSNPAPTLTDKGTKINISQIIGDDINVSHYQFFLNTDGDSFTGYQFGNRIWPDAGADYLIEDGDLYKSTANDDSWSWQASVGEITTDNGSNSFSIDIDKSLLEGLTNRVGLGFIVRDEAWDIDSFYPQSSLMASYTLEADISPNDTEAPLISLNGSDAVRITRGSIFYDPGVYAYDEVDGDISEKAVISSLGFVNGDVMDSAGTKSITYSVTDDAGNTSTALRAVTVVESAESTIVVDGNLNDWSNIPVAASSNTGSIKIENDYAYLNILVEATNLGENTQILIDIDNDTTSGLQFLGGADYMIENRDLSQSTNPSAWSWDYAVSPIHYIKKGNIIEVAILKSNLEGIGDSINIGFINRDSEWNITGELIPSSGMVAYTLAQANEELPTDITNSLCDASQSIPADPTPSLADGFLYNGMRYFSEVVASGENDILNIYSQNQSGTNQIEILSFLDTPSNSVFDGAVTAGVRTTNGGLVISIKPDNLDNRSSRRDFYRLTEGNEVIEYGDLGTRNNVGKSLGFIENTYYQTYKDTVSFPLDTTLYGYNEVTQKELKFFNEELDSFAFDPIYPFRSMYKNGKIYYAYTLGQLVNNRVLTNVGPRILGVIEGDSGLKPVSVCKNESIIGI